MQTEVAQKIFALASRPDLLSESEVSHLMTLSRKYLEHLPRDHGLAFPLIRFFGDWSLHIALDRSQEGMAILRRLNDTLREVADIPDSGIITKRITEVISFGKLRREMGTLFQEVGILNALDTDQERWTNFAKQLIAIIRDCPLFFAEKMSREAKAHYEANAANPLKKGSWVVGLAITEVDYSQFSKIHPKGLVCICVHLSDTTRIVVPMASTEVFGPATE